MNQLTKSSTKFLCKKSEESLRPRLHEQIKHALFAQICPGLLHTDREFEQLKEVLFAQILDPYEVTSDEFAQIKKVLFVHVNAALTRPNISQFQSLKFSR